MTQEKKKGFTKGTWLILLCWLVYVCSYIGKLNYTANITQIQSYYNVKKASAGLVGTFFFFSYGVGQVLNGLLCKKYNIRYIVFGALLLSGCINLAVAFLKTFSVIKYLWLVNGFSMSVLWPTLVRLLTENLSREEMPKASIIMGTAVAVGTLFVYGLSALYVQFAHFKLAFWTAAIVLPSVAVIWMIFYPVLTTKQASAPKTETIADLTNMQKNVSRGTMPKGLLTVIIVMAVYAVLTNLIKDGLVTWVPNILKESFLLSASLSIALTLIMPALATFGTMLAVAMHKKIHDYVFLCVLLFVVSGGAIGGIIGLLSVGHLMITLIVTLICLGVVSLLMAASNNLITSMLPLYMKGKINSGMVAGVLNGCCYIGSMISSYGLGVVVDKWGWTAMFWLLVAACGVVVLIGFVYAMLKKFVLHKKANEE